MREHGPAALVGPVHVSCPFCHATEVLPEQHAQRVTALRARLAQLRAAQAAEEGPSLAYAQTIQTLRSQKWVYAGMGALVIVVTLNGAIQQIRSAVTLTSLSASARGAILASVTYPAISLGVFIGAATGYVLALSHYKKAIAPRLRARAPMQPGLPARCRSCGASLSMTPTASAFVACTHCAANNLITDELARDRVRLLDEEARSYSERAAGVHARANKAAVALQTFFYIGAGVGAVLALALSYLIRTVLETLILGHTQS